LATDASVTHIGAVIQQKRSGSGWRPLGFFSTQLDKAQVNYCAFDRKLLAVVAAIKHFHYMLEGRSFVMFTNHKLLVGALVSVRIHGRLGNSDTFHSSPSSPLALGTSPASQMWSPTLCRAQQWPPLISSPQQLPGVVAAANSGPSEAGNRSTGVKVPSASLVPSAYTGLQVSPSPVDLLALAAAQAQCPECQRAPASSSLQVSVVQRQGTPIMVDTSSGVFRPLVPGGQSSMPSTVFPILASGRPGG
jgi:hypothetical protein